MPPFTYGLHNQQMYAADDDRWTSGDQPVPYSTSEQLGGFAKFGAGVGAVALYGRHRFASGNRGWDHLAAGARAIEEYSPGRVLRTFQLSHMLSGLEREATNTRYFSPELIANLRANPLGQTWLEHTSRLTGTDVGGLVEGFRFENGQLLRGQTGQDVLLKHASIMRSPSGAAPQLQQGFARSLANGPVAEASEAFSQHISYLDKDGKLAKDVMMFTGGQTRLQAAKRSLFGYGTSLVERINQLARSPFELPIISDILKKTPLVNKLKLHVESSSGLKTLGKITGKLGILAPLIYMGYQELDYRTRNAEILDNTILAEGITAAGAKLWTDTQKGLSSIAEVTGLHDYRERQEEIAPGSTNLTTLAAFPIMGALGGAGVGYGLKVSKQISYQRMGFDLPASSHMIEAEQALIRQRLYSAELPKNTMAALSKEATQLVEQQAEKHLGGWAGRMATRIAATQEKRTLLGAAARLFGQVTPNRIRWMTSAAVGAAIVAPFIPGALIPGERPEELEDLYSGKKKVGIRKGRWWEGGRSSWEGDRIDRFQEHWYPRMLARAKEKSIWGEDAPGPIEQAYIENFTYDLEKKHYYDRPYPMCLHPDSAVYVVTKGFIPISQIVVEDQVINSQGIVTKVTNVSSRECWEKEVLAITVAADNRILKLTADHNVLVIQNLNQRNIRECRCRNKETMVASAEPVWIPAKDLKVTDLVLIPNISQHLAEKVILDLSELTQYPYVGDYIVVDARAKQSIVDAVYSNLNSRDSYKQFSIPYKQLHQIKSRGGYKNLQPRFLKVTDELALLFGLYLAEGWTTEHSIQFSFNLSEQSTYAQSVLDISKKYFGASGSIKKVSEEGIRVTIYNTVLVRLLNALFGNKRAPEKYLPLEMLNWPISLKHHLIQGLFRGDGSYEKKREVILTSASSALIADIRFLLMSIGIKSSIRKIIPKKKWKAALIGGNRVIPKNISFTLSISGTDYNAFAEFENEIQASNSRADRKGVLTQNYLFIPIRKITKETWHGQVYDITVADGASFLSTCIVHNSGAAFSDVPFLGPILSKTVGRIFKPAAYMHEEEWRRTGANGEETLLTPPRFGETVLPGEAQKGAPISPFSVKNTIGEEAYRLTEMVGLPGFTMTSFKEAITGEADLFAQEAQLQSASTMYAIEREYWDRDLGGMWGSSELMRRLYPHKRNQIERYNPIKNTMPQWLPGPGDKSPDFQHGDPFAAVKEGEARLPGEGYAALNPDVAGLNPADYPIFHRFKILADVAPYSDKFRDAQRQIQGAIKYKQLTDEQLVEYKEIQEQIKQRKERRTFTPYKWKERARTPIEEILAKANEDAKGSTDDSWFARTVGTAWETLTHNAETPFEYLTPIAPAHKFVHARTAVEDYAANQVYGSQNASWNHPIRDFIKPFATNVRHSLGSDAVPENVQEKRDLEEYFDILKYVKFTRLKEQAEDERDPEAVDKYEDERRSTLFGINPFTFNFSHIFRSLPRNDRDYLNSFMKADTEERAQIMKLVPENEQTLMMARWKLKDMADMQKAVKKGLLTQDQVNNVEALQQKMYTEVRSEGMPKTQELWAEYLKTRYVGESYPDWYRRTKLLPEKLDGRGLPGADWVGWSSAVDLEDIKLKIISQEGKNTYDYDMWPDRKRAVARRPIINTAAEELQEASKNPEDIKARINEILKANNVQSTHVSLYPVSGTSKNSMNMQLEEDRYRSDKHKIRKALSG